MKKDNLFWGLFLIAAAFLILVAKLGVFPDMSVMKIFWTLVFVVALVNSLVNLAFPGVFFSLAFLGIIYDTELGITAITPWTILFVALLLSIGVSLIYTPKKKMKKVKNHEIDGSDFVVFDEEDGNQFDFSSSFVGSIKYVNSDNFESANIDAKFAGMKVYFDNAVIQNGHATVNLNVSFAGVELYVPKNWRIDNQMTASFGGVEEKNRNAGADGPILTLRGNVSLGGVTILYI
ncbi:MAG: hypothetical protein IJ429_02990 [Lachnospiraceae bacterium]|nr:hypothetical protein [Lachnospiraceae bacterium]